jgi:hypothetical protein
MNILIDDYILEQENDRFNLYKKAVATKKEDGSKYDTQYTLGYGMSLESCVQNIILMNLEDKKVNVSLEVFIKEYKKERERITNLLK